VRYTLQALKYMADEGLKSLDVREDIYEEYNGRIDAANALMAWGAENVSSWYKSPSGRVSQNWPLHTVEFWAMTREFNPAEFHLRKSLTSKPQ
jgi:4-hydroxyacetophenone monooxygenase